MSYINSVLSAAPLIARKWDKNERIKLQNALRLVLPVHRVAACLHTRIGGAGVSINYSSATHSTRLGGVMVCGNHNLCPVCHHNHMAEEKETISKIVADHYAGGMGYIVNCTLTVPHALHENMSVVCDRLEDVWMQFRTKAIWRKLERDLGVTGYIRRIEVKITENGWHVHYHLALLCEWGKSREVKGHTRDAVHTDVHAIVAAAWGAAGTKAGIRLSLWGQAATALVAAVDGIKAMAYNAKNMGYDGDAESLTPFDLLRIVDQSSDATAVKASKILFLDYAAAIKGKHSLTMIGKARHIKAGFDKPKKVEEERLGLLSPPCWDAVLSVGLREAVAMVTTRDGLREIVRRVSVLNGLPGVPEGWLTLATEVKYVVSMNGSCGLNPTTPIAREAPI